ncbi:MAG: ABC transporter permease [Mesorhizobium sp.]|nr:ABC transporter permease [Mesorhizobium sp.]
MSALLFFSVAGLLGNPAAVMLGLDATPEAIAEVERLYGFDRPLWEQYVAWIANAVQGDLGRSYTTKQTVADMIGPRLPVTIELGSLAIILALLSSVIINSLTFGRRVIRPVAAAVAILGVTLPNFVIGLILMFLFAVQLGWLPTIGWASWSSGVGTHFFHLLLPVMTLSGYYYGAFTIVYRTEYENVSHMSFIQTARAKGLSEGRISFRHILPNSILPVITYVGLSMGQLIGGAVVVESLYSIPGIGSLLVNSVLSRDFPVMLAIGIVVVISVVVMNALADAAYAVANPQIRLG